MARTVVSLGSNLGDRNYYINEMEKALATYAEILKESPLFRTAPVGVSQEHGDYLNKVLLLETSLSAPAFLTELQKTERHLGRNRKGTLAPRTADLDILLFEGVTMQTETLTIPHHALFERRFSYEGTLFVAPDWVLDTGETVSEYSVDKEVFTQEVSIVS